MKTWIFLMELGAKSGCHQMAERSFFVAGYQMPLCARCLGVLLGQAVALCLSPFFMPGPAHLLLMAPLAIDGLTQLAGWRHSNNPLRIITGLLAGYGYFSFVIAMLVLCVKWLAAVR